MILYTVLIATVSALTATVVGFYGGLSAYKHMLKASAEVMVRHGFSDKSGIKLNKLSMSLMSIKWRMNDHEIYEVNIDHKLTIISAKPRNNVFLMIEPTSKNLSKLSFSHHEEIQAIRKKCVDEECSPNVELWHRARKLKNELGFNE